MSRLLPLCESQDMATMSIGRNLPSYFPDLLSSLTSNVPAPFSSMETLQDDTSRDRS